MTKQHSSGMKRGLARWRRDWRRRGRSGSAAVEFAIMLPVFLAILFGIIQFGSVLFLHNNMVNAAREAARRMSVAELDKPAAEAYVQNYLAGWNLPFQVNATVPAPGVINGDVIMQVTVPAADAALINFPIAWPGNLVAQATMRRES
jgi:Flp pilus assembly protein TadG